MKLNYSWILLLLPLAAFGEDGPQTVVVAGQTDVEASRDFIAGKLVISKKTLQESGAQNVAEVLRREPAITVGKDGRIGLLGLPGYTQVLVDGQAATGVDPYDLDLVQVEKIEIIKSATAATGPMGIAGTINIVRRKTERKALTQARASASTVSGHPGVNATLSSNQLPSTTSLAYNFTLVGSRKDTPTVEQYRQEQSIDSSPFRQQLAGKRSSINTTESLAASTEISWAVSSAHKLSASPDVGRFKVNDDSLEQRLWVDQSSVALQRENRQQLTSFAIPLTWDWKVSPETRFSLRLNANRMRAVIGDQRQENWSLEGTHLRLQDRQRDFANRLLDINFNTEFDGGHEVSAGIKLAVNDTENIYRDKIDGEPDLSEVVLGSSNHSHVWRRQYFVQDDWRISKLLAVGVGISTEQRTHELREGSVVNHPEFRMWSPSLHGAYKIGGNSKRQLRASIAQTFLPPEARQMLLHPMINPLAPCYSATLCGMNTLDTADFAGNPGLRPERSVGLNLSYSHGIGANSEAKIELYSRNITRKIGNEFILENVAWANAPRYLLRPTNLGDATLRGVNLEGRLALRDLWKQAGDVVLQGSIGYAQSELRTLPGPDNRLEGQLPWRAKLGLAYSPANVPLKFNVDANWLPADWTRNNLTERTFQSRKFTLNTSANWKINANQRLIFNADNLFSKAADTIHDYYSVNQTLRRYGTSSAYARLAVRLETNL